MPTTLEDLPGPAHDTIASMLPDGLSRLPNRRRLALVSRALLSFHGGTLTSLCVHWRSENHVAALATLLEARRLEWVYVADPEALPSLTVVLAQGCLRHVQKLELWLFKDGMRTVTFRQIFSIATAMQMPGALDALVILHFYSEEELPLGTFQLLAAALASGAAPSLRHLHLGASRYMLEDDYMKALVEMVEARAALRPACRGLEVVEDNEYWGGSEAVRSQLLRALLPSLIDLKLSTWDQSYEECFLSVGAPQLKKLKVMLECDGRVRPSAKMWESMPRIGEAELRRGANRLRGR